MGSGYLSTYSGFPDAYTDPLSLTCSRSGGGYVAATDACGEALCRGLRIKVRPPGAPASSDMQLPAILMSCRRGVQFIAALTRASPRQRLKMQ
jgi:hypothetical protein